MKRILHNRVPFIWIQLKLAMYYKTVWLCQCDTVYSFFQGTKSCILILPVFYTQPIGGAWRLPLQYIPLTPPVQPALRWLHLYDTPSPCHSLLQAPPTAAEQPGYSRHELFKLASCALIERQGSVGQKAGGWHSRCVEYFYPCSQSPSWSARNCWGWAGCAVTQCQLTSWNQQLSAGDAAVKCGSTNGEWTQHGVRGGLQLCL